MLIVLIRLAPVHDATSWIIGLDLLAVDGRKRALDPYAELHCFNEHTQNELQLPM